MATHGYYYNTKKDETHLNNIIKEIKANKIVHETKLAKILAKYPRSDSNFFTKSQILKFYRNQKDVKLNQDQEQLLQKKATRTISGVTPVTVFTKPFPCPGKCIFCPNDVRMPKSYLSSEPGAKRAERNKFNPYYQTYNRLVALNNIGHPTDKVELIISGGTWSSYPEDYQIWFIKRCFEALNDFQSNKFPENIEPEIDLPYDINLILELEKNKQLTYNQIVSLSQNKHLHEKATFQELFKVQKINETAITRAVGLVIETRPDEINKQEALKLRTLGMTKVQIGVQSLNDTVLRKNKRNYTVKTIKKAFALLRSFGFKIQIHWMPNLYGSTPEKDIQDYQKIFQAKDYRPDEIKIYPCSLIKNTELFNLYKIDLWRPYSEKELLKILIKCLKNTPGYCRITRLIRDISSEDIVIGNRKSNLRQIIEKELSEKKINIAEIRFREIKDREIKIKDLKLRVNKYQTNISEEYFLEYVTNNNNIVGFLRLSCQKKSAIIRELHIYGPSLTIGSKDKTKSQHQGLGLKLLKKAEEIAHRKGYQKINVISAVGTREYYRKKGFQDGKLYQYKKLI